LGAQSYVSNIGYPQLIDRRDRDFSCQVRIDRKVVTRIGGNQKARPTHTQQIVFTHHCQHTLVVDWETALLQFYRDSSIAICRPLHGDLLHLIAQVNFHWRGQSRHAPAIESGPVETRDLAQYRSEEHTSELQSPM